MTVAAGQRDLTAKARIRNAALELFAQFGEEGTSMRRIAEGAGVTVGLIVHHFGTKARLREEVELHIVDLFTEAIASVPRTATRAALANVVIRLLPKCSPPNRS